MVQLSCEHFTQSISNGLGCWHHWTEWSVLLVKLGQTIETCWHGTYWTGKWIFFFRDEFFFLQVSKDSGQSIFILHGWVSVDGSEGRRIINDGVHLPKIIGAIHDDDTTTLVRFSDDDRSVIRQHRSTWNVCRCSFPICSSSTWAVRRTVLAIDLSCDATCNWVDDNSWRTFMFAGFCS